jgi:iron complex transport system substrate-binding protein
MNIRKFFMSTVCVLAILAAGCTPKNAATTAQKPAGGGQFLTLTDDAGRKVELAKKPVRVVSLSNSYLSFVEVAKGDLVGVVSAKAAKAKIPAKFAQLPTVGEVYNVNTEALVNLKPDLILGNKNQHEKLVPILEANHIPILLFSTKSYEDVKRTLTSIGKIYGHEAEATAKIKAMDAEIASIVAKVPHKQLKVAIIHATPSNVTVELDGSIAGDVAKRLGFTNVAVGAAPLKDNPERTPYSMEVLVQQNPDVIFITSMGEPGKIEARLKLDIKSNPSWNSLQAVQKNKIYVLPENLFLLNPGLAYPEAVKFMAKTIYPEVF